MMEPSVEPSDPNYPRVPGPGDIEIPNRVFVKGFCRDTTEMDLKAFFQQMGAVRDCKIVRDKSGVSKGYAFVTFDSDDVANSIKDQGSIGFYERKLNVGPAIRKRRTMMKAKANFLLPAQPMLYGVSHDGVWYFQPTVSQVVPFMPALSTPLSVQPCPSLAAGQLGPTTAAAPHVFWTQAGSPAHLHSYAPRTILWSAGCSAGDILGKRATNGYCAGTASSDIDSSSQTEGAPQLDELRENKNSESEQQVESEPSCTRLTREWTSRRELIPSRPASCSRAALSSPAPQCIVGARSNHSGILGE